jgi:hypothetical protein
MGLLSTLFSSIILLFVVAGAYILIDATQSVAPQDAIVQGTTNDVTTGLHFLRSPVSADFITYAIVGFLALLLFSGLYHLYRRWGRGEQNG